MPRHAAPQPLRDAFAEFASNGWYMGRLVRDLPARPLENRDALRKLLAFALKA